MRRLLTSLAATLALAPAPGRSADDTKPAPAPAAAAPQAPAKPPGYTPEDEARVLELVRRELPELAALLEPLKAAGRAEYTKAIGGMAAEAKSLQEMRSKNPTRYPLSLESWKARTRVELIAAQLAKSPSPGREAQLRSAIEARVEADVRRQRFDLEQAEANVARIRQNLARAEAARDRARGTLDRTEKGRGAQVDARFQALVPKPKPAPAPTPAPAPPKADPAPKAEPTPSPKSPN